VHLTPITNALGYEVQLLVAGVWTTVTFSSQARTISLTGLTTRTTLPFIYPVSEVNGHLLPMS
jgi:hypothetical protein